MAYASSGSPDQGPLSLDRHKLLVTFFKSVTDTSQDPQLLTLPELAKRIRRTEASDKKQLPLLKLVKFGNSRARKAIRNKANAGYITGIEVEHDGKHEGGIISFDDVLKTMRAARLRCIAYTTPSHTLEAPRWRILLPCSADTAVDARDALVDRVNGLFDGKLAVPDSWNVALPFYFGIVNTKLFRLEIIDGDFIDQRADLKTITRAAVAMRQRVAGGAVSDYDAMTIDELIAHLDKRSKNPEQKMHWHDPVRDLAAKMAARGRSEAEIIAACAPYSDYGATDPEMLELVWSGLKKYGWKPPIDGAVLRKALEKAKAQAAPEAPPPVLDGPPRPAVNAKLDEKINWLLDRYAFSAVAKCVIDMFEPSEECRLEMKAWKEGYADWREVEDGPRGGKIVTRATDAWSVNTRRTRLRGVRMAPDKAFPLFEDRGLIYKNTYRRPSHAGDGEVETFNEFLVHLLPDDRERDWFWQWLAYKHRHPEVPGVGIIFMAKNVFGCGRGILFSIARELYGPRYVRQEDFDVIAGDSPQGAFTDWVVASVLVCVDETQASPTSHRRGHKLSVYEKFKKVVDPAARSRTVRGKNIAAYESDVYASFWMATNHGDPFVIPENDRRIVVLTNGVKLAEDLAERIAAWRDQPGNIARLARELEAEDLSGFNPREPIETAGKTTMAEEGLNDVERALFDIRESKAYGPVFTPAQIKTLLLSRPELQGASSGWMVDGAVRDHTVLVTTKDGAARRTVVGQSKVYLRCFPANMLRVRDMTAEAIRASLKRWDAPLSGQGLLFVVPKTVEDSPE